MRAIAALSLLLAGPLAVIGDSSCDISHYEVSLQSEIKRPGALPEVTSELSLTVMANDEAPTASFEFASIQDALDYLYTINTLLADKIIVKLKSGEHYIEADGLTIDLDRLPITGIKGSDTDPALVFQPTGGSRFTTGITRRPANVTDNSLVTLRGAATWVTQFENLYYASGDHTQSTIFEVGAGVRVRFEQGVLRHSKVFLAATNYGQTKTHVTFKDFVTSALHEGVGESGLVLRGNVVASFDSSNIMGIEDSNDYPAVGVKASAGAVVRGVASPGLHVSRVADGIVLDTGAKLVYGEAGVEGEDMVYISEFKNRAVVASSGAGIEAPGTPLAGALHIMCMGTRDPSVPKGFGDRIGLDFTSRASGTVKGLFTEGECGNRVVSQMNARVSLYNWKDVSYEYSGASGATLANVLVDNHGSVKVSHSCAFNLDASSACGKCNGGKAPGTLGCTSGGAFRYTGQEPAVTNDADDFFSWDFSGQAQAYF